MTIKLHKRISFTRDLFNLTILIKCHKSFYFRFLKSIYSFCSCDGWYFFSHFPFLKCVLLSTFSIFNFSFIYFIIAFYFFLLKDKYPSECLGCKKLSIMIKHFMFLMLKMLRKGFFIRNSKWCTIFIIVLHTKYVCFKKERKIAFEYW